MRVAGIIAEYNPFHNGHAYHIAQSRRLTNADAVIVIMSGAFTQRGEAAILDKWTRAEMALKNGADMVIELPCLFALREARGFAEGGVQLLSRLGIVDAIAFGCEEECIGLIESVAKCLLEEPAEYKDELHRLLDSGLSYPKARAKAAAVTLGIDESALDRPNFALALEYAQANMRLEHPLELMPVTRTSDFHSEELAEICSASAIRAAIQRGDTCAALNCLPENCREEFRLALGGGAGREACALTDASFIDDLALFTLRQHSPQSLSAFAGVSEGLENLLIQKARVSPDVQSLLSACKSKRYTLSRLRRLLPQIALGITHSMQVESPCPTYARVLGCRRDALYLMGEIQRRGDIPITPGGRALDGDPIWEIETRATDLWGLATRSAEWRRAGMDYTHKFVVVD